MKRIKIENETFKEIYPVVRDKELVIYKGDYNYFYTENEKGEITQVVGWEIYMDTNKGKIHLGLDLRNESDEIAKMMIEWVMNQIKKKYISPEFIQ